MIKACVRNYLSSPQHLDEDLTEFISREKQNLCNNSIASTATTGSSKQQPQQEQCQPLLSSSSPLSDTSNGQTGDYQFQSPSSSPQQTTSNGTCSYATCSELEALLPTGTQGGNSSVDNFEEGERLQWEPLLGSDKFSRPRPPRFEAFMMTGDLILNLSRTQQSSGLLPKHQKKVDSLRHHHHHHHHYNHHHHHNSVPTSPNEMEMGHKSHYYKSASAPPGGTTSAGTSPVGLNKRDNSVCNQPSCTASSSNPDTKSSASAFPYHHAVGGFVRTSRSEDHLQFQKDSSMSAVDIDIDEDVTSSLNTLLDTRQDSGGSSNNVAHPSGVGDATDTTTNNDRIVWTYNAPIVSSPSNSGSDNSCCGGISSVASRSGSSAASRSASCTSSEGISPQRSLSPASPTSVSSSVMSSNSSSRKIPLLIAGAATGPVGDSTSYLQQPNGDLSQSEAISNISSPDFQEEETLDILSSRDLMEVSDPSDSDSTLLVSDRTPVATVMNNNNSQQVHHVNNNKNQNPSSMLADGVHLHSNVVGQGSAEHRIVIQVKGPDKEGSVLRAPSSPRGTRRTHRGGAVPPLASKELDLLYSGLSAQQPSRSPSSLSSGNVTPELAGYQVMQYILH